MTASSVDRLISVAMAASTLAVLYLSACGDSTASVPYRGIDIYIDQSKCTIACPITHYAIFLVQDESRAPCILAWGATAGDEEYTLKNAGIPLNRTIRIGVLAFCSADDCVRCHSFESLTLDGQSRSTIMLQPLQTCSAPELVIAPCTRCIPSSGTYCFNNQLVSCNAAGQPVFEQCTKRCELHRCID